MAETTISGTTRRNNGGVIAFSNKASTNNVAISDVGYTRIGAQRIGDFRSIQETGAAGASGVKIARSGGNFNKMVAGEYLLTGYSTKIAGISDNTLKYPAVESATYARTSINRAESRRTRKIVTAGWNYVTGQPLSNPAVSTDTFGNDDTSRPTRSIPGEFVYHEGKGTPTQANYRALST